jgi:hypothetical protein
MRTSAFFAAIDESERPALKSDFEPLVVQRQEQGVNGSLRHADGKHAGEPAPHGERLVGVEQRVGQRPEPLFGHFTQRAHRFLRDCVPGEQRNHMRHERRCQALLVAQHAHDPIPIP